MRSDPAPSNDMRRFRHASPLYACRRPPVADDESAAFAARCIKEAQLPAIRHASRRCAQMLAMPGVFFEARQQRGYFMAFQRQRDILILFSPPRLISPFVHHIIGLIFHCSYRPWLAPTSATSALSHAAERTAYETVCCRPSTAGERHHYFARYAVLPDISFQAFIFAFARTGRSFLSPQLLLPHAEFII